MGLLSSIAGLPVAPIRMVMSLAEVIQRQVERELRSPAAVRHELERAAEARDAGEISAEREDQIQQQALDRVIQPVQSPQEKG